MKNHNNFKLIHLSNVELHSHYVIICIKKPFSRIYIMVMEELGCSDKY